MQPGAGKERRAPSVDAPQDSGRGHTVLWDLEWAGVLLMPLVVHQEP